MDWFWNNWRKVDQHNTWTDWNVYTQTQCDAHFNFKNGQLIVAQVVILSAERLVFSSLFQSNFKDSLTREVFIEDTDMQVFQYFLKY
jgi:hypothetical protein